MIQNIDNDNDTHENDDNAVYDQLIVHFIFILRGDDVKITMVEENIYNDTVEYVNNT